jgi:hypothetical protein
VNTSRVSVCYDYHAGHIVRPVGIFESKDLKNIDPQVAESVIEFL